MRPVGIFNEVLGPVMRGPSSSHTAGAYRIGRLVRALLGAEPSRVVCRFHPGGSMATTYEPLAVDRALAAGLMEWDLLDRRFGDALEHARKTGIDLSFEVADFPEADHPNAFDIRLEHLESGGTHALRVLAKSIGGGAIRVTSVGGHPVELAGGHFETIVEVEAAAAEEIVRRFSVRTRDQSPPPDGDVRRAVQISSREALDVDELEWLAASPAVTTVWRCQPLLFVERGEPCFASAEAMLCLAAERDLSLGQLGLEYESRLLGLSHDETLEEMLRRYGVMKGSVARGLEGEGIDMQLLEPSARRLMRAEANGELAVGGLHTRAAVRAMAVMHVSNSLGVVCAAPTAGSAGVLPAVLVTLAEEKDLPEARAALALFAASAIGLIVAYRGTFAAEIAGCQVEIGAAGAMAAAAVVDASGGSARQAADAAAIALQNTMGSVCDPVQGACEVPCHTRNAAAAAAAFVCADLVLGGYRNPIPLDETIDASIEVGRHLPASLRCTALGGLAATPSAQRMPNRWKLRPQRG